MLIEKKQSKYSMQKQCQLLGINWSSMYYEPVGISEVDQKMMNLLDEEYTEHLFYGVPKMTEYLNIKGYKVGKCHTRTLLGKMGLKAVVPKPNTSKAHSENKIYPYLLREVMINRVNQVWSADITYIKLRQGYAYLVVIMDWYSRYILSWRISNTLDNSFCIEALEEALSKYGNPEIFNSDQGSQFTSEEFISRLVARNISISMDGKWNYFDNIFVERLWRTVKYENVYLNNYQNIFEVKNGLGKYFEFYNRERFHQALDYKTPWDVYFGGYKDIKPDENVCLNANKSDFLMEKR